MNLDTWLKQQTQEAGLIEILNSLATASTQILQHLRSADVDTLQSSSLTNVQGEVQQELDIISNDIVKAAMAGIKSVKALASEEEETVVPQNENGKYLVAFDPLDGSSNLAINISVGTIFSILPAIDSLAAKDETAFLQLGKNQLASGFFVYGTSCLFILTLGHGVYIFAYNPQTEDFCLFKNAVTIPAKTQEFSINMSNYHFWQEGVKDYIDLALLGKQAILAKQYNMRWVASMVAEAYRILVRGGLFSYPEDNRSGEYKGKLRLLYECNPIALIVEQADGIASDGKKRVLDLQPISLHQRVGVVLGSKEEVEIYLSYIK